MTPIPGQKLRDITSFPQLVRYLADELDWPIDARNFDDCAFEWDAAEDFGVAPEHAAKIRDIKQLRPVTDHQPWGIFFIEFEPRKLPVGVLRRLLNKLVTKQRASANPADRQTWALDDLLFISSFGENAASRELAFAHFHQEDGDLPTLRVLGWDGGDTPLKLDHVDRELHARLRWPANDADADAWRTQWGRAFKHRLGHTIQTADMLAKVLAELARSIRDRCRTLIAAEPDSGPLKQLFKAFQSALIHDLTEESFADTYAQTITYGLLTAAISRTDRAGGEGTFVQADNVTDMVPVTNPFLREMLRSFLEAGGRRGGLDFDELGVQDVVELLRDQEQTDLAAVLRDFGNRNPSEDPVIRFYEDFLAAYNKELKVKRGVFYTPQPVVSYIVRSVHELLQTEFGLEDGLASSITWGEMIQKIPDIKLPPRTDEHNCEETIDPSEFFVQILDPATGTGTFIVETIDVIHKHLKAKWEKSGPGSMPPISGFKSQPSSFTDYWNTYIPAALLPRLYAYELLMAPYAIAHMKIGLKLHETGYRFGSEERVRVYLTNALEPKVRQLPTIHFAALAHEAAAVNEVKWYKRFTVVIGNPPYAVKSYNNSPWILNLIEDFKRGLNETKINLDDDFIKFMRFAAYQAKISGTAVVGMITNNIFFSGVTHRQMRSFLHDQFQIAYFSNLHGDSRYNEIPPFGLKNDNVFDIQQGVSISICVQGVPGGRRCTSYADVWGSYAEKAEVLLGSAAISHTPIQPLPPYFFIQLPSQIDTAGYSAWPLLTEWMPVFSNGVETHKDALTIHFTEHELKSAAATLLSLSTEKARQVLDVGKDGRDWQLHNAIESLRRMSVPRLSIQTITYRPFDTRYTALNHESGGFIAYPRWEVMSHLIDIPGNLALVSARLQARGGEWDSCLVTRFPTEKKTGDSTRSSTIFPLFVTADGLFRSASVRSPNVSPNLIRDIKSRFGEECSNPSTILSYLYALTHSPSYRSRYAEFLKIDFPRLPLPGNLELFRSLARLGGELVALHLLESPKLAQPITEFIGGRQPEVEKISWSRNTVWLDKAQITGFQGVPENVWNFHIGGYQVCEKWLKDRKGRTLTDDDITHYHKIVVALSQTIRLMAEIDTVIETHGGWPAAFTPATQETINYPEPQSELRMAAEGEE